MTKEYYLDVSPADGGKVEVNGSAWDSFPATRSVKAGRAVLLEAVPEPGFSFTGWGGDLTGSLNPAEVEINVDKEIVANFAPITRRFLSEDGKLDIAIPGWVSALDGVGDPLTAVVCTAVEAPSPPEDASIIGPVYNLAPDGATFDNLITVTWQYEPGQIPEGVVEEDLTVAYYAEGSGTWTPLSSFVDPETDTIKTFVSHFSVFAVIAPIPPPPPPAPAAFTTSILKVTPAEVELGESVGISVLLRNTGEEVGSYPLALRINGTAAETKEITLAGGESKTVVFTTTMEEAGDYPVAVDELSGSFTVNEAPSAVPIGWTMLTILIVAGFLAVFLPLRLRKEKVDR